MQGASFITGPFITPAGVKNRPFQAQYEHVALRRLPNGETSRRVKKGAIYRAADGRSRREEYAGDGAGKIIKTIIIHDPIRQEGYLLDPESKTFFTMPVPDSPRSATSGSEAELPTFTGEDIGKKTVDGLICRGYRRERPGGGVVEYWVSEELLEAVLARTVAGDQDDALRIFGIRRGEPDNTLFNVPPEYQAITIE